MVNIRKIVKDMVDAVPEEKLKKSLGNVRRYHGKGY